MRLQTAAGDDPVFAREGQNLGPPTIAENARGSVRCQARAVACVQTHLGWQRRCCEDYNRAVHFVAAMGRLRQSPSNSAVKALAVVQKLAKALQAVGQTGAAARPNDHA